MVERRNRNTHQTLYLFLGFLILFALSFSLGVMVGKRGAETGVKTEVAREKSPTGPVFEERMPPEEKITDEASDDGETARNEPELGGNEDAEPLTESQVEEEIIEEPLPGEEAAKEKVTAESPVISPPAEEKAEKEAPTLEQETSSAEEQKEQKEETAAEEQAAPARKELAALPKIDADGKYTVQLGSFQDQQKADKFLEALRTRGYPVFLKQVEIPGSGTWYRARVGTFSSRDEARLYAENLKNREPDVVRSVFVTIND